MSTHNLVITDFRNFNLVNNGATKAFVDIEFNNGLIVKGFKILETQTDQGTRVWVSAPARPSPNKKQGGKTIWSDIVYCDKDSGAWNYIAEKTLDYYYKNAKKVMP